MPTRTISQTIDLTNKPINKYITEITDGGIKVHDSDDVLNYIQLTSDGMEIFKIDGAESNPSTISVAKFGSAVRIGKLTAAHSIIDANGQRFYASDGTTQLANIGYGAGTAESGTSTAPYYTFGERQTTTAVYDSSSTYDIGDICVYDDELYVCIEVIETAEAWNSSHWQLAIGNYSLVEGTSGIASGVRAHAEGHDTVAIGWEAHAEGSSTLAKGTGSHAEGRLTKALGTWSHAEGDIYSKATGYASHSESRAKANGDYSHAEGYATAGGDYSHAEGYSLTQANGDYSHAEGYNTVASGESSHAEGYYTVASGDYSHAEGNATASGDYSHAQNRKTIAAKEAQTALGRYNKEDTTAGAYGDYAVIIGNGASENSRSNALTVSWQGSVETAGYIQIPKGKNIYLEGDNYINKFYCSTGSGTDNIYYKTDGYHAFLTADSTTRFYIQNTQVNSNVPYKAGGVKLFTIGWTAEVDNAQIAANGYADYKITIPSKSNYTPIAVVGYYFANATTNGANSSSISCNMAYYVSSENKARLMCRNHASSVARVRYAAAILYVATTQGI